MILLVMGWLLAAPSALLFLIGFGGQLVGLVVPGWLLISLFVGTCTGGALVLAGQTIKTR